MSSRKDYECDTISTVLLLDDYDAGDCDDDVDNHGNHNISPHMLSASLPTYQVVSAWQSSTSAPPSVSHCKHSRCFRQPASSEHLEKRITCLEIMLFIITVIIWIGGMLCVGLGVWQSKSALQVPRLLISEFDLSFSLLIATGLAVSLFTLFGFSVVICRKRAFIHGYVIIVGCLLVLTMYTMWHVVLITTKVHSIVEGNVAGSMQRSYSDGQVEKALNTVQSKLQCCGSGGAHDWKSPGHNTSLPFPTSCCQAVTSLSDFRRIMLHHKEWSPCLDIGLNRSRKTILATSTQGCTAVLEKVFSSSLQIFNILLSFIVFLLWLSLMTITMYSRLLCRLPTTSSPNQSA